MHQFDAVQEDSRTAKFLEAEHWIDNEFDGPVVLFNEVIEVFRFANCDGGFPFGIDVMEGGQMEALPSMVTFSGAPF